MSGTTPDDLAVRVCRHLERMNAWLADSVPLLDALPGGDAGGPAADDALRAQGDALAHLLREHGALRREWDAGAPDDPAARARVAALSDAFEALAGQWRAARAAAEARVDQDRRGTEADLAALGRGRALSRRMRLDEAPGQLDRQA